MAIDHPRRIRKWFCGGLLLLSCGVAAAAETFAFDIAPGKFDEHCLSIRAGETIRWRFVSSGAVEFNLHAHRGNTVVYPVRRVAVQRASGGFRSPDTEDYCLMWTNPGVAGVSLRGGIERLR